MCEVAQANETLMSSNMEDGLRKEPPEFVG